MSDIVVGVDAGGTSTVVLVDGMASGQRRVVGDAANARTRDVVDAAAVIARTIRNAVSEQSPRAIFVGAAGAGSLSRAAELKAALTTHFSGTYIGVADDAHIALRASVATGNGVLLIVGTGSIAYAEIDGARHRVGGHGYLLGDEGSGYSIGNAALRLLLKSYDGRAPFDPLLEAISSALGVSDASEAVARIHDDPAQVRTIASLAKIVIEKADDGERSAAKIVQGAALEAFDLLKSVVRVAGVGERDTPVVLAGGLFSKNSLFSYLVETRISNEFPHLQPLKNGPGGEHGALAEAHALRS